VEEGASVGSYEYHEAIGGIRKAVGLGGEISLIPEFCIRNVNY
jgi:hypothetical protein